MSLFEDSRFQWRETYFVLFDAKNRPTSAAVKKALQELKAGLNINESTDGDNGELEGMTLLSHIDSSGIDITYIEGDEVREQIVELKKEFRGQSLTTEEKAKFDRMLLSNARFDVFHFEEMGDSLDEDDGPLDPGTLLLVLARLAKLCHGVAVDPQAGGIL
ncbi:hypothetical protein NA78x_004939 [Anatilimnocola sp. NA78]|uniref:hypothetical protein n=1 Tax=Anatilimnocola sp. NA78 TaxID=3415683 RepID=UPI003CE4571D